MSCTQLEEIIIPAPLPCSSVTTPRAHSWPTTCFSSSGREKKIVTLPFRFPFAAFSTFKFPLPHLPYTLLSQPARLPHRGALSPESPHRPSTHQSPPCSAMPCHDMPGPASHLAIHLAIHPIRLSNPHLMPSSTSLAPLATPHPR